MPTPNPIWRAARSLGLSAALVASFFSFAARAQVSSPPVTPAAQAAAWEQPRIEPVPPVVTPGQPIQPGSPQVNGPTTVPRTDTVGQDPSEAGRDPRNGRERVDRNGALRANPLATVLQAGALAQTQAAAVAMQQAQRNAEVEAANAANAAEGEPNAADTVEDEAAAPGEEQAAPAIASRVLTLASPTGLDARGADGGAKLSWRLPDGGRAFRYAIYCDDGTLAASSVQRTVLASDECPSQVAFVAGARPEAGWRACAELDGALSGADLSGLDNGQPYAFAVAARDESGVLGAFSSVSCAIPSANGELELDDPTEATTPALTSVDEGCSATPGGAGLAATPIVLGSLVGALALFSRRRARRGQKR